MNIPLGSTATARSGADPVRPRSESLSPGVSRTRSAAPPWASGIVVGVETAVLSAGLVFAFVFAAVASAPSIDGSISADWAGAWNVGTSVWLLAHGVSITTGGVTIALIPLGLTLMVGVMASSVARRVAVPAHASILCAALSYGVIVAIIAASEHDGAATVWKAGIIGGLASGMGASIGLTRAYGFAFFGRLRLPSVVGLGYRLGLGTWATCLAAGAVLAITWQLLAVDETAEAVHDLAPDLAGGLTFAVGETAYVPTLVVWALAWLSGQGFALGSGSVYAPGEVVVGPVPKLPLLASLPEGAGGVLTAAPLILVLGGILVRIVARRSIPLGSPGISAQAIAVLVTGGLTWGAVTLASGSAGGGALVEAGPQPFPVGLTVGALVGVGFLLASLGFKVSPWLAARNRISQTRRAAVPPPTTSPETRPQTPENRDPLRLW